MEFSNYVFKLWQSIIQCSDSRIYNSIPFKTVEESTSKLEQGEYTIYKIVHVDVNNRLIFFSYLWCVIQIS